MGGYVFFFKWNILIPKLIKINTGKADNKTNEFKIPYLILLVLNFEKYILTKKQIKWLPP